MEKENMTIGGGLRATPKDDRDFVHDSVFGSITQEIPDRYLIPVLIVKNQRDTDYCTAYATTSVSEDQEGVELNPQWTFALTKHLSGESIDEWGANLRDACKSHTKVGALAQADMPLSKKKLDIVKDRDELADYYQYPVTTYSKALQHKKKSYFRVDLGPGTTFENIKSALWRNREGKRSIATGSTWFSSWTNAPEGVISKKDPSGPVGGHAFKICGFTKLQGEDYLIAQLSNGTDIGNAGLFYFPENIVNKYFTFGAFMFRDEDPENIKRMVRYGIVTTDSLWSRLFKIITTLIKERL